MTASTSRATQSPHLPSEQSFTSSDPSSSFIRRSWHSMAEMISPFSSKALESLPKRPLGLPDRSIRTDDIPEAGTSVHGVRDYNSINNSGLPPGVRIPKKIATPIKVESKVWFANERTWVAYTNLGLLLSAMALALFEASKDNISRYFGYTYALISCVVIVYGYCIYQKRVTMIRRRDPGHFNEIWGPVAISALLFTAVLVNFVIRLREILKSRSMPP